MMRKLGLLIPLALIGFALAGCAGASRSQTSAPTGSAESRTTAAPSRAIPPRPVRIVDLPRAQMHQLRLAGHGAGFVSPTRLAVMTAGSSNCRGVPSTIAVSTPDSIRLRFKEDMPANGICLANLIYEPVVIAISPTQINVHRKLTIRVYYPRARRPTVFTAPPLS